MSRQRTKIAGRSFLTSRLIMETHLKRKLLPNEIVHHKDGNESNDADENLEVLTREDHSKLSTSKWLEVGHKASWCSRCKLFLDISAFNFKANRWNGCRDWCRECEDDYRNEWLSKRFLNIIKVELEGGEE